MAHNPASPEKIGGYRLTMILLSIATVALTFLGVIYYRYVDERDRNVAKIDHKIEQLSRRLTELQEIPKIRVSVRTLKDSGLPEAAFTALSHIPAVVNVEHVSGRTAKGVTVRLSSKTKVSTIASDSPIEALSTHLSDDAHTLTIQVPQLRRNTSVQLTLFQKTLGVITHTTLIDEGEALPEKPPAPPQGPRTRQSGEGYISWARELMFGGFAPRLDLQDVENIAPERLTDPIEALGNIDALRTLKKRIASEPVIQLAPGAPSGLVTALLLSFFITAAWFAVFDALALRMRKQVSTAMEAGEIQIGQTQSAVQTTLGKWDRKIFPVADSAEIDEMWLYAPHQSTLLRRSALGVVLFFKGATVTTIHRLSAARL